MEWKGLACETRYMHGGMVGIWWVYGGMLGIWWACMVNRYPYGVVVFLSREPKIEAMVFTLSAAWSAHNCYYMYSIMHSHEMLFCTGIYYICLHV